MPPPSSAMHHQRQSQRQRPRAWLAALLAAPGLAGIRGRP